MTAQGHTINDIGVAVDIGSTSIGVCCMDLCHRTEILSFSFANPQYIYGADVVTRIKHCVDDKKKAEEMKSLVENTLQERLREHLGTDYQHVSRIVYSGNTTMLHILRELSLDGFAYAPFQPADMDYYETKVCLSRNCKGIQEKHWEITKQYLPGFSAFVGADILSGATYLEMGRMKNYDFLIDLGTNGELLLLNEEKGFATSTACGPVFDHVICGAKYGSDSMKVIANCVKRGLIDKAGTLADAFFEKGISIDKNFTIKQENIRNFQLAKGAIRAGIQCLMDKAEITVNDIDRVYISGGLGFYMNIRDAFTLKLLPEKFKDKIIVSGNTSLEGARKVLLASDEERAHLLQEYDAMRNRTESFELANCEGFQEIYMNSLNF